MSLRLVIICAFVLMLISIANANSVTFQQDQSVSIPLSVVKKPAADLIGPQGELLDPGQAAAMAQRGFDLSQLNPMDNKIWQNKVYSASDTLARFFPKGNSGVKFLSFEAQIPSAFTAMMRVQSQENPNQFFRMGLSRYSHTTMMRAALLRKLGFFVPSPKYYKDLRVYFADEEEKKIFLDSVQSTMTADFNSRGWITQDDQKTHSIVFSDAILEPAQDEYFDIQWGFAPNPNIPEQLGMVQRYSKFRAYRGLLLPFTLVDVPESVNRYSAKLGSILSGFVIINHPSAASFSAATVEDIKWLLNRLGQLTYKDYQEIVNEGAFPTELNELILAKLLYRAHNAFELFQTKPAQVMNLPSLDITSASGLVVHGKVMREFVPGYPQRFSHGDRESPFKDGDLGRYLNIRGKSSVLSTALSELNKKLQILTTSDAVASRRIDIQNKIIDHIKKHPFEPLYQNIEAWGGPLAGFNVSATRNVATGTYFGSTAAIQLVDNMSVSGSLGYFMTLDGVKNISPIGGANLNVQRDYTHVRPVLSIEEGTKISWQNLLIPRFMSHLADVLKSDELIPGKTANDPKQNPLDAFLNDMREGEVFTVSDSVTLATYAQISSSFDVLMGITPLNFLNSVALGADGSRVTLQQTSFMKTSQGIQVYVRKQKADVFGTTLDVNYFINLIKIRAQTQKTDIHTDAFVINYNPADSALSQESGSTTPTDAALKARDLQRKIRVSLLSIFKQNEVEFLYKNFQYQKFDINHLLDTRETRVKFLMFQSNAYTEDHWLQLIYPRNEEAPELNPENEKVLIYRRKKAELQGQDLLGLGTDLLQAWINKKSKVAWDLNASQDPNPANIPFGKAYWKMITTEADLSPGSVQYPSVGIIQHVWGGWHINSDKFLNLVNEISSPFQKSGMIPYRLIEKEAFLNVKAIDFYRITEQLSVLPTGLDKIRDLIVPQNVVGTVTKSQFLGRIFQKLSQMFGGKKARAEDKQMFNQVMSVLGNGDLKVGLTAFNQTCNQAHTRPGLGGTTNTGYWINGTNYDCLMPWITQLLDYSTKYPKDKESQTRWMTEVLSILDQQIPMPQLLKYLGQENYIFFVRINGFRTGDEDGDLEYFSNSIGDPSQNSEYANGLVSLYSSKTHISPVELDRSQGSFK